MKCKKLRLIVKKQNFFDFWLDLYSENDKVMLYIPLFSIVIALVTSIAFPFIYIYWFFFREKEYYLEE